MSKESYFSNWKKIFAVSYGLVYVMFTVWVIAHVPDFVPAEKQSTYYTAFILYGILNSIIFGNADLRNKLFNVKFVDFVPRFAAFFVISYLIFNFILNSHWFNIESVLTASKIPLWLSLAHAVVFATTESVIWQGFLDYKIGHPASEISAGLFHLFIWTGPHLIVIASASLLFAFFSFINWYYRSDKNDLAPSIGVHSSFNLAKLIQVGGF